MSRIGIYLGLSFAVAALGILAWSAASVASRVHDMERSLHQIASQQEARELVAHRFVRWPPMARQRLCPEEPNGDKSAACRAVSVKNYQDLGQHNDLWVYLDAVVQVSSARHPDEQRRRLDRLHVDLARALSEFGALDAAHERLGSRHAIMANELYAAVVAHMGVCHEMAGRFPCRKGLPVRLANVMGRLAAFLLHGGRQAAPYEVAIRQEAIEGLIDGGLLPVYGPQEGLDEPTLLTDAR